MNADERTMTNVNEYMNESANENIEVNVGENANECKELKTGGSKWKHVAIGGVAGVMMGVAGTIVGTESAEAAGGNAGAGTDADGAALAAATATDVPVATTVNDEMSFGEAFAAARAEVGAGGVFEWHGNTYNTYYAEEWKAMSPAERQAFFAAVAGTDAADVATATTVTDVDVVDDASSDDDVRVIGVYEENMDGQEVYIGAMEVGGDSVMLVDVDHDGVFDVAVVDADANGTITEDEVEDISDFAIGVDDMVLRADMDNANELLAANDMPDYVNDADVSMC